MTSPGILVPKSNCDHMPWDSAKAGENLPEAYRGNIYDHTDDVIYESHRDQLLHSNQEKPVHSGKLEMVSSAPVSDVCLMPNSYLP